MQFKEDFEISNNISQIQNYNNSDTLDLNPFETKEEEIHQKKRDTTEEMDPYGFLYEKNPPYPSQTMDLEEFKKNTPQPTQTNYYQEEEEQYDVNISQNLPLAFESNQSLYQGKMPEKQQKSSKIKVTKKIQKTPQEKHTKKKPSTRTKEQKTPQKKSPTRTNNQKTSQQETTQEKSDTKIKNTESKPMDLVFSNIRLFINLKKFLKSLHSPDQKKRELLEKILREMGQLDKINQYIKQFNLNEVFLKYSELDKHIGKIMGVPVKTCKDYITMIKKGYFYEKPETIQDFLDIWDVRNQTTGDLRQFIRKKQREFGTYDTQNSTKSNNMKGEKKQSEHGQFLNDIDIIKIITIQKQ